MAGLNTKTRDGKRPSHHASMPSWHAIYHKQSANTTTSTITHKIHLSGFPYFINTSKTRTILQDNDD